VTRLVEKFSSTPEYRRDVLPGSGQRPTSELTVTADADAVTVAFDGGQLRLTREQADDLRQALGEALTQRREFLRTAGEHREDGSYVVSRRGANSAGHRKVFDSFENLQRLYRRLPAEFTAETVGRTGLTGGRRHMLVWHLVEHPAFDCELVSRQPLTVRKTSASAGGSDVASSDTEPASSDHVSATTRDLEPEVSDA